ncbi:MAG TPA: response regulator, partial [Fibrobacteraceae bacterium]|nr:response regulator [Fibrobacteraceae bacterium]
MIKVLVVDDSAIFRLILGNALAAVPNVSVVGRCRDGKQALDMIRTEKPDLVTLDVEMPIMDGLRTLREIRNLAKTEPIFSKIRVVMVSSLTKEGTDTTIQGMNEGALDCIPKPEEGDADKNLDALITHLSRAVDIVRVQQEMERKKEAAPSIPSFRNEAAPTQQSPTGPAILSKIRIINPLAICIGVSTGGPAALTSMLPELCKVTRLPILIVQHMPPG